MTPRQKRSRANFEFLRGRKVVLLVGMGLALLAGLGIALFLIGRDAGPTGAPPASQGGLVVQTGRDDDIKLDARRPLRCFVKGQLVGELALADCAQRNGVASGALDVGLDPSGALAATNGVSTQITPLPPEKSDTGPPGEQAAESPMMASAARVAGCWRYGEAEWSRLPDDLTLPACIRTLYSGICVRTGPPAYGRWGDRTLRLAEGRIEISPDNHNFHVLSDRNPGCQSQPSG